MVSVSSWEHSRAVEVLSLVVGSVLVLELGGHGLGLVGSVGGADKVTPGNAVKRVTGGTDLTVDWEKSVPNPSLHL